MPYIFLSIPHVCMDYRYFGTTYMSRATSCYILCNKSSPLFLKFYCTSKHSTQKYFLSVFSGLVIIFFLNSDNAISSSSLSTVTLFCFLLLLIFSTFSLLFLSLIYLSPIYISFLKYFLGKLAQQPTVSVCRMIMEFLEWAVFLLKIFWVIFHLNHLRLVCIY